MRFVILLIASALLAHPAARAAAVDAPSSTLSGTDADTDRTMEGKVDQHAHEIVSKWLRANPNRDLTLRLNSGGGSVQYGAMLFNAIGTHGRTSTDVRPGQSCLSACAYIWLAGHARTVGEHSVLGFHSAYCTGPGPCDPRVVGVINQVILDTLARTEPALAVLVSKTGAMIIGNHLLALATRENGRWTMRTYMPPTTVAQR